MPLDRKIRYVRKDGANSGYWYIENDEILVEDIENLIFEAGSRKQYLVVVTGKPFVISPEWDMKHPAGVLNAYDYAVSYAIPARTFGIMLDANEEEDAVTMFNYYLNSKETLKGWETISEVKIVNQQKWKNTYDKR